MKALASLKRYSFHAGHYLFAGVLMLRLLSIARLSASSFLMPARGDMQFYNDWAQRILHGEWTTHTAFYGLPLYAYLLAFLYKLFGYSPFVPALIQASFDAGTSVLIYRLAIIVSTPSAALAATTSRLGVPFASHLREIFGLIAGVSWAFFVPAQAYSIILMPTAWMIFAFWLVVWIIVRNERAPTARSCFWLGLLVGFVAMGIATILFLIPLIVAALFLKRPPVAGAHPGNRRRFPALLVSTILLLSGVLTGTAPCWIHNYYVARDSVFLSAHSGVNFWIGNNPEANGYPHFPPGMRAGQAAMLEDSIATAEAAAGHSLKRGDVSRYWSAQAKHYIAQHPWPWIQLLGKKIGNFWNSFQYDDLSIITILRQNNIIFPGLYFGLAATFALPGIILGWQRFPKSRWLTMAIVLHLAALLPVFVTERYRLAVAPALLVFSLLGLSIFWQACALRQSSVVVMYLALLGAAAAMTTWPQRNPSLWALDAYNAGWQALESNNLALAERKLATARAYVPANAEITFALGNLRLAQEDRASATSFYRETLRIETNHKGALNNLGVIAIEGHDAAAARTFLQRALVQDPRNAKTHFLLAKTALIARDFREAQLELNAAVKLAGSLPEFATLQQEIEQQPGQ